MALRTKRRNFQIGTLHSPEEIVVGVFVTGLVEEIEVDVLLCNKTVAVAVEVKTTCFKKDVDYFIKQMKRFKEIFHEFEGKTIFLAIAAMRFANGSDKYALRNGLYVLSPLSDGMFTLGKPNNRKEF